MADREKHQKFRILDAPGLLEGDLKDEVGLFGVAVLYIDLDGFKALNTKYTERVVDKTILPEFQQFIASTVQSHGCAYAEGGDEVIILLRNVTPQLAVAFAESLREKIAAHSFTVYQEAVSMTVSIGLAAASDAGHVAELPERANAAKAHAKLSGKNCTSVWEPDGCRRVGEPSGPDAEVEPPNPSVFFNDRVCDAFPGVRGLAVFDAPNEIIARLSELLKEPLEFKGQAPIWTMTGRGDMYLKRFEVIDDTRVRIGVHRYVVKRLAVFRGCHTGRISCTSSMARMNQQDCMLRSSQMSPLDTWNRLVVSRRSTVCGRAP
jgi:diguanylate cyclase (GGDEF)-like protein